MSKIEQSLSNHTQQMAGHLAEIDAMAALEKEVMAELQAEDVLRVGLVFWPCCTC